MLGHEFKQSIDLGVAQVPRLCPDEHTSENARSTKAKTRGPDLNSLVRYLENMGMKVLMLLSSVTRRAYDAGDVISFDM